MDKLQKLEAFCLVAGLMACCAIYAAHLTDPPRLVGYGCEGQLFAQYHDEEDEFPRCERIERVK